MFRRAFNPWYNFNTSWRDMEQLQREMNRFFASTEPATASTFPVMNVWTNEGGAVVTAEVPGVNAEALDIAVAGNTLKLSGSREAEKLPEGGQYHRRERTNGQFSRTFQFPFNINAAGIEAMFEKGVLHITLPRAEEEKPKKIHVKSIG